MCSGAPDGVGTVHVLSEMEVAMAQEKPRATRARKKTTEIVEPTAVAPKQRKRATASTATQRSRKSTATLVPPSSELVAFHAYLLWERGEPGDAQEHWLRAEQELDVG
jgi:hypothetical protein